MTVGRAWAALILSWAAAGCRAPCGDTLAREMVAPDGRATVRTLVRDCGAPAASAHVVELELSGSFGGATERLYSSQHGGHLLKSAQTLLSRNCERAKWVTRLFGCYRPCEREASRDGAKVSRGAPPSNNALKLTRSVGLSRMEALRASMQRLLRPSQLNALFDALFDRPHRVPEGRRDERLARKARD